ncbi:MAG: class I SAM-dependent methyltransferase [Gallionella sp.]|nr:class I SAM-dependent methyltransferase [Gallionella sp.]
MLAPALAEGGAGFRPEAFEQLAALEAQNFWFRARNRLIVWALKRHFPNMQHYLEIGCGTGYVLAGVAQAYPLATLVGSEVFSVGLPYAASRVKTAELLQMDARQIPYVEEFDVIGAFDVLEHIEEDEVVLAAMLRALRPGGGVAISVPQHPWLWSMADASARHVRRYKVGELREKVLRAGFKLEFETSFVSLLLPAMLASRLTKQRGNFRDNSLPELRLPSWLNRVFEIVMSLESYLIRSGLRLKLGGSRFLIATKER